MKKIILLLSIFSLLLGCNKKQSPQASASKEPATAAEVNQRLGRGINMGNMFEAGEAWQGTLHPDYFRLIAEQGFKHVRIPIKWERADRSSATSPYTIQLSFLQTIKNTIDAALKNKLHVIINMHHHDALLADPAGQRERFLSQWVQISEYFKNYPDSLLFEILNEPNGTMTAALWNEYAAAALNIIRQTNPWRAVLIGTPDWGGVASVAKLIIPDDAHLILTVHYYNPFNFTHQGASWVANSDPWLGTRWNDTQYERDAVINDFKKVIQVSQEKNIPVHVGEFGAFSRADMESRVRWTRFLARWFELQKFSWAYWEFSSGFGIYDPVTGQFLTSLAQALTKDPMVAATQTQLKTLYSSNFSGDQKDGWNIYNTNASAASTMSITDGRMQATITQPGTESWHIQFIRNGFSVEKGKIYRASFNAYSNGSKLIQGGVSQNSAPWANYSGSHSFNINTSDASYSFVFTSPVSDADARLVFSIGNSGTTNATLYNISLQEVLLNQ